MPPRESETPVHASAFGCITVPCLLIALIPLLWGARSSWSNGELSRTGESVPGRVVELRHVPENSSVGGQGTRGGGAGGRSPVVTFRTRGGEERTVIGSVNRHPEPWAVGETVEIVYDPANPARADLRSELEGWRLWFGIWCVVAAVPAALAIIPIALYLRQRRGRDGPTPERSAAR